ncbi:probable serine/threonine-protein kinase cdc7 [Eurosta solidaginis]|uniref:probable serine/threonine-protein kinase cdc7 n=1 Tax=Eurosta solidaginis TaxID=178769 RepID=UPI0035312C47
MQTSPSPSPPDFDFNLPCRYFKSSFARSLSMHNGGAGMNDDANEMQCKSLDFDIGPYRKISTFNSNNNSNIDIQNIDTKSLECPPLPQRRLPSTATTNTKNEAAISMSKHNNTNANNNKNMAYYESDLSDESIEEDVEKPPAIPARCPIVVPKSKSVGALNLPPRHQSQTQMQQQQHQLLAQFRHVAIAENANASGNVVAAAINPATTKTNTAAAVNPTYGNFNRPINHNKQHKPQHQQQQQYQQQLNCQANSNHSSNSNNNNNSLNSARIGKSRCNLSNSRNVWPTDRDASQQQQQQHNQHQQRQQQQQQDDKLLFDVADDVHVEVDNNSNGCLMNAMPPVAATRSTLTPHYASTATKTNIALTPKAIARPTPPCIEQQQRLNAFKAYNGNATTTTTTPTTTANVQVVLLQNQVDTLQWQLKQVETSNEMYRAVIEEIARFLDRYLTQKQQQRQLQQQQQISRSKSLFQVYDGNNSNCEGHEENTNGDIDTLNDKSIASATSSASSSSTCLRTRSTSNLITDLKHGPTKTSNANTKHTTLATTVEQKRCSDAINMYNNNNPYTAFKDFTWRRSPKKCAESKALAAANEVEEKLNKEAFRLSRTIQNLLNTSTGQPDLTLHRGALTTRTNTTIAHSKLSQVLTPSHTAAPTIPTAQTTAHAGVMAKPANGANDSMNSRALPPQHTANNMLANNQSAAEMLFLRANHIRDSRISLRSSTDSSVHSTISNSSVVSSSSSSAASTTSSGKVETDDDITLHHPFHALALPFKQMQHPLNSATEDESGFSSISSFQDIGVPLCSTMISNGTSTPNRLSLASVKLDTVSLSNGSDVVIGGAGGAGGSVRDMEANEFVGGGDSRNSTLKANHPSNVLGVPLQATHDMQHRWDTPTSTTTATKTNYRSANKYQRFSTLSNEDAAAVLWV